MLGLTKNECFCNSEDVRVSTTAVRRTCSWPAAAASDSDASLQQNFLNSSSCPEIQGFLHVKELGRKSWRKLYVCLRRSGLYCSTKGASKVGFKAAAATTVTPGWGQSEGTRLPWKSTSGSPALVITGEAVSQFPAHWSPSEAGQLPRHAGPPAGQPRSWEQSLLGGLSPWRMLTQFPGYGTGHPGWPWGGW